MCSCLSKCAKWRRRNGHRSPFHFWQIALHVPNDLFLPHTIFKKCSSLHIHEDNHAKWTACAILPVWQNMNPHCVIRLEAMAWVCTCGDVFAQIYPCRSEQINPQKLKTCSLKQYNPYTLSNITVPKWTLMVTVITTGLRSWQQCEQTHMV